MIMSRSVKSVFVCPGPAGPKITCSIIFKITIVVLIIQLHNSLAYRTRHSRGPGQSPNGHALDDPDSTAFDGYKKSYGLKFRNPHFELSMKRKEHKITKMGVRPREDIVEKAGTLSVKKDKSTYIPEIPKRCEKELICEDNPSYPYDAVAKLVEDSTNLQVLAAEMDEPPPGDRTYAYDSHSNNLCVSNDINWKPSNIRKSRQAEWYTVVNVDKFMQIFRAYPCLNAEARCDTHFSSSSELSSGRHPICKQQYRYQLMFVLDPADNEMVIQDLFPVPSGCCCHVRRNSTSEPIS